MAQLKGDYQFQVKWHPFQLNSQTPEQGVNKVQMYSQKFGMGQEQVFAMADNMKQRFTSVGLPFVFTDKAVIGNTFEAHRLTAYAAAKHGLGVQDKLAEELFLNYFGEEKFLGDPAVLVAAAVKSGIPEEEAKKVVGDRAVYRTETEEEMKLAAKMRHKGLTGVPFFIFSVEGGKKEKYLSGAHPSEDMVECIEMVAKANK